MIETLTVRPAFLLALERGEEKARHVRWLYEQGSQYDFDVYHAMRRAAFVTDWAREQARWERVGRPHPQLIKTKERLSISSNADGGRVGSP